MVGRRDPSLSTLLVLRSLLGQPNGQHYGMQIAEGTGIKSGVLYPILTRLESDGLIEGQWEDIDESAAGRRRRRWYRLTDDGRVQAYGLLTSALERLSLPQDETPAGRRTGRRPAQC